MLSQSGSGSDSFEEDDLSGGRGAGRGGRLEPPPLPPVLLASGLLARQAPKALPSSSRLPASKDWGGYGSGETVRGNAEVFSMVP